MPHRKPPFSASAGLFDEPAPAPAAPASPVWAVGQLCRAVAQALEQRFNPIRVQGEISGLTRAASGHCYLQRDRKSVV